MAKGQPKQKVATKAKKEVKHRNLFESTPRNFRIGMNVQPKRDLTRFVKWPRYILLQRQKRILYKRLKVPPTINQFTNTLPADKAKALFKLLAKYKPEAKAEKKARLLQAAENKNAKKEEESKRPLFVKAGLNHVTTLVEQGKAKLVVIAHDVDPIELVLWLPHLCRNKNVAYCFVKSKARLGQLVGKKTATCLAITDVRKEDSAEFDRLVQNFRSNYNDNKEHFAKYGDIVLGIKAQKRIEKQQKAKEAELLQKA